MKKLFTTIFLFGLFIFSTFGQNLTGYTEMQPTSSDYANFIANRVCEGDTTVLISTSYVTPPDSITNYIWDLNGDLIFGNPGDAYGPIVTTVFPAAASYNVGLRIYTKLFKMYSIYKQVDVSKLIARFEYQNDCLSDSTLFFDLSDTINATITNYTWDLGDGLAILHDRNPVYQYSQPGLYNVTLTIYSDNGCQSSMTKAIDIKPVPTVNLSYTIDGYTQTPTFIDGIPHFTFYEGQGLTVTVSAQGYIAGIQWSTGEGDGTVTFRQSGEYWVKVTDDNGCYSIAYFIIDKLLDNPVNPVTVITPNDDGYNDKFIIKHVILENEKFDVKIFNRWGDEVYSNSDYQNNWEGTYNGNKLPEGTYYYFIKGIDSKTYEGPINILLNKK